MVKKGMRGSKTTSFMLIQVQRSLPLALANISSIPGRKRGHRKARISRSVFSPSLFLSTASVLQLQPVALYNSPPPQPPLSSPPPLLNEEARVCCIRLSCMCVCACACWSARATEEHVGASNSTVESGRVRVAFCGGVK